MMHQRQLHEYIGYINASQNYQQTKEAKVDDTNRIEVIKKCINFQQPTPSQLMLHRDDNLQVIYHDLLVLQSKVKPRLIAATTEVERRAETPSTTLGAQSEAQTKRKFDVKIRQINQSSTMEQSLEQIPIPCHTHKMIELQSKNRSLVHSRFELNEAALMP